MFSSLVLRESKRARVPFSWHAPLRLAFEHARAYANLSVVRCVRVGLREDKVGLPISNLRPLTFFISLALCRIHLKL